jgi:hypothetical protein
MTPLVDWPPAIFTQPGSRSAVYKHRTVYSITHVGAARASDSLGGAGALEP